MQNFTLLTAVALSLLPLSSAMAETGQQDWPIWYADEEPGTLRPVTRESEADAGAAQDGGNGPSAAPSGLSGWRKSFEDLKRRALEWRTRTDASEMQTDTGAGGNPPPDGGQTQTISPSSLTPETAQQDGPESTGNGEPPLPRLFNTVNGAGQGKSPVESTAATLDAKQIAKQIQSDMALFNAIRQQRGLSGAAADTICTASTSSPLANADACVNSAMILLPQAIATRQQDPATARKMEALVAARIIAASTELKKAGDLSTLSGARLTQLASISAALNTAVLTLQQSKR